MTDQSPFVSMWNFITAWFPSPSLFLVLNLVIGTIALTSRFQKRTQPNDSPQLARAPSLLERVKSFNLSLHKFDTPIPQTESESEHTNLVYPPRLVRAPSLLERVKSFNFSSLCRSDSQNSRPEPESMDQRPDWEDSGRVFEQHVVRSKSENGGGAPTRQPEKMKKSASEKSVAAAAHLEEEEVVEKRRPETARMEKTASFGGGDEGVDAKADDFINRFRQQLKLQRLDSLLRYREMLSRGSTSTTN